MTPRRLAFVLLLVAAAFGTACNIGPQPLPPGFDGANGDVSADAGSIVSPDEDAGAAVPSAGSDSGSFSPDGGSAPGDAALDGDGGASSDASIDAGIDAGTEAGPADSGALTNDD